MNVNFGLFPPPTAAPAEGKKRLKGRDRKRAYTARALADLDTWRRSADQRAAE